uniref:Uncharacterized protein n=1 Tax=Hucho hucho TaxID=62062 RepID=A0A4W5LSE0_9TELE
MDKQESSVTSSLKKSLAASSGAMMTSLFVTPLDVAKVRLQAQTQTSAFSTTASCKTKTSCLSKCVQHAPRITPCRSMRNPLLACRRRSSTTRRTTTSCTKARRSSPKSRF